MTPKISNLSVTAVRCGPIVRGERVAWVARVLRRGAVMYVHVPPHSGTIIALTMQLLIAVCRDQGAGLEACPTTAATLARPDAFRPA
ncbi:hypothetical protein GCM10020220_046260 [Nonomuraea rubra]